MKNKQIINIELAFSCPQKWEDMTVCENGRFCLGCQKTVFDFTNKNQTDFDYLYAKNDGQLCGRFTKSQLNARNFLGKIALISSMLYPIDLDAQTDSLSKLQHISIDTVKPIIHEEVFIGMIGETQPEFEGGMLALYKFIAENLRYPDQNCVEGTIYVGFIVDTNGNLKNLEVKRGFKSLPQYNEEAIRVIKLTSGKWRAGLNKGKPVETRYTLPIKFKLY
jgi:hypothetical protein